MEEYKYLGTNNIHDYCAKYTSNLSKILSDIFEETRDNVHGAHMLSGKLVSKFLQLLIRFQNPSLCVDVGSYTGFSALTMAESTDSSSIIYTIDRFGQVGHKILKKYIDNSIYKNKIKLLQGDGIEIIGKLPNGIDFIFVDANKRETKTYFDTLCNKMSNNGLVVVDDVLWYGQVLSPKNNRARAMHNFNEYIKNKEGWENVIFPIRHGLNVIYKK